MANIRGRHLEQQEWELVHTALAHYVDIAKAEEDKERAGMLCESLEVRASSQAGTATKFSVEHRMEAQRLALFDTQAIIAIARDSVSTEENDPLHRVLDVAYHRLEQLAVELERIASKAEVIHG